MPLAQRFFLCIRIYILWGSEGQKESKSQGKVHHKGSEGQKDVREPGKSPSSEF
ncbi:hypothetical protein JOC74_004790 [Bacillus capparidis]|uniref:Uncharacterized protein n=1 Tax=Bacillus capparidis TaxID=1840411 RepID=A0ABS4D3N5_9BACI|nr:hypothetical protein [Bacillus capparidis]